MNKKEKLLEHIVNCSIAISVNRVFAKYENHPLPIPALISLSIAEMSEDSLTFELLSQMTNDYIRSNMDGKGDCLFEYDRDKKELKRLAKPIDTSHLKW